MNVAFHFDVRKPLDSSGVIYGMEVATFDWFRAYFRYGTQEKFNLLIDETTHLDALRKVADEVGLDPSRLVALDRRYVEQNFNGFDLIFCHDPSARRLFWQRQVLAGTGFAFCGLAHAISGLEVGELLEQYCLAPTYGSDALVSPSRAVKAAIRAFWDNYGAYLRERFGAAYRCPVELPVIPLGINIERFEQLASADKRVSQRTALGVSDDEFVVLWVGRLSHAIKAHPIAMFQAAERAAQMSGKPVHLVMYGYFVPENAEPQFRALAAALCPTAKVTFVDNKDARFPDGLWAAGDAFISLIDNMQESFGLTPIEAMAAGLPRIISDWDGYRDSVMHGEDGFLIPTTQPPPGQGAALASLLLSGQEMYGGFLGKTALTAAVDAEAAAQAIVALIQNPALRASMAEKAKQRVRRDYDWRVIIPAYEALWREQVAKRRAEQAEPSKRPVWPSVLPQCPDPFTMYAAFPTRGMAETDRLKITATPEQVRMLWGHEINVYGLDMMLDPAVIPALINHITKNRDVSIAAVFLAFPTCDRPALWRTLAWLMKLGIVARVA